MLPDSPQSSSAVAMVVMSTVLAIGSWAFPHKLNAAMMLVTAETCQL